VSHIAGRFELQLAASAAQRGIGFFTNCFAARTSFHGNERKNEKQPDDTSVTNGRTEAAFIRKTT
jgi:hypothetical protein